MEPASSDSEIIARSLEDPDAFEEIFDRYYLSVRGYLARCGDPEAAGDLAQEVFLRAFRSRRRFRLEADSAAPWLFGIATNVLRRHLRRRHRRGRALLRLGPRRQARVEDPYERADQRLSAAEWAGALQDALAELREPDRDVLLLYALGQLTYREVAEALGIPIGTVRSRLARARRQLRELLGPLQEMYGGSGEQAGNNQWEANGRD